jgi:hypothetical protein
MRLPKKSKASRERIATEIPRGAVIYGYATVEVADGVWQVYIHGRNGAYTSLLVKKRAREVILPGATICNRPSDL